MISEPTMAMPEPDLDPPDEPRHETEAERVANLVEDVQTGLDWIRSRDCPSGGRAQATMRALLGVDGDADFEVIPRFLCDEGDRELLEIVLTKLAGIRREGVTE